MTPGIGHPKHWRGWCLAAGPAVFAFRVIAATNAPAGDEIPPLRPPRPELPPGVWEQYGAWILAGAILLLALIAAVGWLLTRRKPNPPVPPDVQALATLNSLAALPEDGLLLSRISQVLRRYVASVLELPQGERTTTETSRAIAGDEKLEPATKEELITFLKACDQRKFAPPMPQPPLGAVQEAAHFVQVIAASHAVGLPSNAPDER